MYRALAQDQSLRNTVRYFRTGVKDAWARFDMKCHDPYRVARLLTAAFFFAFLAPSAVPAAAIEVTKTDYAVGLSSVSVVPADFNSDGKLDLAVVNVGSATVSVLLGNGDGTFKPQATYPTGDVPQYAVAGDFNRDGHLDLAVSDREAGGVAVLLGNGDGTFQLPINSPAGGTAAIVAGDFNRDGHLDVAITNLNGSNLSILLGNGDGTFQPPINYATGTFAYSIATADFNGDGKHDLAVTNNADSTVSVLLGEGDGTFQAHVDYASAPGPYWVTTADFNGDGKVDLAVSNQGYAGQNPESVSVLLGNGDGTFRPRVDFRVGNGPVWVTSADFNGDGKLDLATANVWNNTISLLLGNGDGTFQSYVDIATDTGPASVATGDFNSDGRMDLAVSYDGGTWVSVFLQTRSDNTPPTLTVSATPKTLSPPNGKMVPVTISGMISTRLKVF